MVRPSGIDSALLPVVGLPLLAAATLLASSALVEAAWAVAAALSSFFSRASRRLRWAAISARSSSSTAAWAGVRPRARLPKQARMARLIGCLCIVSPPCGFNSRVLPGASGSGPEAIRNKAPFDLLSLFRPGTITGNESGRRDCPAPSRPRRQDENSAGGGPPRALRMGGEGPDSGGQRGRCDRPRRSRRTFPADRRIRRRAARPLAARQGRPGGPAQPARPRFARAGADLHGARFGR